MIVIDGKEIATDAEGYLADLGDWDERVAEHLAGEDNLPLTDSHWQIVNFIRGYYHEHGTSPNLRILQKALREEFGDEVGDKKYLFELFPYGPAKQAGRYAGMPKPTGCV
ncbi:MAG: TusE/DsrC/DsvC family sulfur relay protein [Betaproteobacteria bacterium]|nr:TusE/DsrC/DsvC family sulfur relay protein [Betaproteobacteria bacterium]